MAGPEKLGAHRTGAASHETARDIPIGRVRQFMRMQGAPGGERGGANDALKREGLIGDGGFGVRIWSRSLVKEGGALTINDGTGGQAHERFPSSRAGEE